MGINRDHAIDLRTFCQQFQKAAGFVPGAVLIVNEERSTSVTETFFRLFSAHFTVRAWFLLPCTLCLLGLLHASCSICRFYICMTLFTASDRFADLFAAPALSTYRQSLRQRSYNLCRSCQIKAKQ